MITEPDTQSSTSLISLQLKEFVQQIEQLRHSKECLAKQKDLGVISENDALEMSKFYDTKIAKAEFEIEEIQSRKQRMQNCMNEIREQYRKYFEMTELTRGIVVTFIEKIEVFSKNKIRIFFRYEDFFRTDGDTNGT